jgi:hypothetical protein
MKNFEKKSANIILFIIIVLIACVVGYFVVVKKLNVSSPISIEKSPTPQVTSSNTNQTNKINSNLTSKNGGDIQIVNKNIGRLVFQTTNDGLEGISATGLVKARSATYSDAFVVGIAQYSSNSESSRALTDLIKKEKELGRGVDFNSETKIYTVRNISNQSLLLMWQSGTYLVFIGIILPPEQLQQYNNDALPYLNELKSEYVKIYPAE